MRYMALYLAVGISEARSGNTMVALFDSDEPLRELWFRADSGEISLGFPAAAMVEAAAGRNRSTGWDPLL